MANKQYIILKMLFCLQTDENFCQTFIVGNYDWKSLNTRGCSLLYKVYCLSLVNYNY